MKKDSISTLSSELGSQKVRRAPLASGVKPNGGLKPKASEPRQRREVVRTNGKTGAVRSSGGGEFERLDADRILSAFVALKKGDFSARLPLGWTGIAGKVADTFNDLAEMMSLSTTD